VRNVILSFMKYAHQKSIANVCPDNIQDISPS